MRTAVIIVALWILSFCGMWASSLISPSAMVIAVMVLSTILGFLGCALGAVCGTRAVLRWYERDLKPGNHE